MVIMISPAEAKEKAASGWFNIWLAFEGMAISQQVIKSALDDLLGKLEDDQKIKVYEKEYLEPVKVENPLKGIKEAWSQVVNVKFVAKNFGEIVQIVVQYGPSAVEILGPSKSQMSISEAQDILNNIAGMMHRYAAAGIGGSVFVHSK